MSSKEDKIFQVALSIFELEELHGHLGWKVTQIVEVSGVSRSLIYRYFGSSKEEILLEAVKAFLMRFYGFDGEEKLSFIEKLTNARKLIEDYPQAGMFYLKWRTSESDLKDEFLKIEGLYQQALKEMLPHFNEEELMAFHVCIHGFVTAPFLKSGEVEKVWSAFAGMSREGF